MTRIDLDFVRGSFPSIQDDIVLLDNAGGSQVTRQVGDRLADFLFGPNAQLGASYATSVTAGEKVREGRNALAMMMNAERPEEVVMGASTSQLFDQLARSLVANWDEGDEVIVTNFDHEANIGAWRNLTSQGIRIREWKIRPGAHQPDLDDLRKLLTGKTRLVAFTHVSNVFGGINPVREIAELVHAHDALICVDGVAFAPHRAVDVQALGADFYGFSVYKVFGPHHAALYGRYDLLRAAGNINHYFYGDDKVPQKLELGNPNYELAYSCLGVTDYLDAFAQAHGISASGRDALEAAFDIIADHEAGITKLLLDYLSGREDVTIIGDPSADPARRVATVSFIMKGRNSRDVVEAIDPSGIGIRFGDFHSKRLVEAMDLPNPDGVIRVSAAHYNTASEIDQLIDRLDSLPSPAD